MSAAWPGLRRVLRIATRRSAERDADSEIDFHLESRTRALMTLGHDATEARAMAEREFGDVAETRLMLTGVVRRRQQRVHRADWWEALGQDLTVAARALRRTPGMTAMIVALLVLGVGANAATFAVADELFLRAPAGVTDPSTLTRLYLRTNDWWDGAKVARPTFEYAAYEAIKSAVGEHASLAAYMPPDSADVTIAGTTRTLRVSYATANYFPLLGVRVALGRAFTADENRMGAGSPVAVISWATWQSVFGGESTVLGKRLSVAGELYTVIGVTAEGFSGPDLDRTELWLPIATYPGGTVWNTPWYQFWYADAFVRVLARVAPNVTRPTLTAIASTAYHSGQLEQDSGNRDTVGTVLGGPLLEARGPTMSAAEGAITSRLVGVTIVVLLVACANVANLLLLRGLRRRRDVAIRLTLGISPGRLIRQFLLESFLLAGLASVPVIVIATWGGELLRTMVLPSNALERRSAQLASDRRFDCSRAPDGRDRGNRSSAARASNRSCGCVHQRRARRKRGLFRATRRFARRTGGPLSGPPCRCRILRLQPAIGPKHRCGLRHRSYRLWYGSLPQPNRSLPPSRQRDAGDRTRCRASRSVVATAQRSALRIGRPGQCRADGSGMDGARVSAGRPFGQRWNGRHNDADFQR
ncbi:MAG TPA: ABC transporter permease [Gemmatimonadaceae bacterium]